MTQVSRIESESNARFKRWRKLAQENRAVKKEGATLLEGAHLAQSLLDHPEIELNAILVSAKGLSPEAQSLRGALEASRRAPVFELSGALYDMLSPVEHGVGLMLEIAVPKADATLLGTPCDVLYLDGVQDAGNAGTLIRTAVAAGVKTIVTSPTTVLLWTPKVMRAAMGAHFGATLIESVPVAAFREAFHGMILVADARGGEDLFRTQDYPETHTAWVMGAEGPGISDVALSLSDRRYYIPIEEDCESLNVAAAAAVCLFEQRRRRLMRQPSG